MIEITKHNFEQYLDEGVLFAAMTKGNWWRMRRNGKTKTLKRRPEYKSVPYKVGFKECGRLDTDATYWSNVQSYFRHEDDVPRR